MYKIRVNDKFSFDVESIDDKTVVNGKLFEADILNISEREFHLIFNNKSISVELVDIDKSLKTCTIRVNHTNYEMILTDQFDELLHKLGMDDLNTTKVAELKAPMPGLVLKVLVSEGEEIRKGANLLILEAMKMENIIKSPGDLVVKSIKVTAGDKVEKNAIMLTFS